MSGRIRFGPFEADVTSGELWRDGVVVPLQDLPFRLLAALVERPGEVVSRAELTTRLWGSDTYVDAAAGLNTAVAKLREALGDDAEQPAYVETVPKRGYRFIGSIEIADARLKPRAPSTARELEAPPSTTEREASAERNSAPSSPSARRAVVWAAAAMVALAIGAFAAYQVRAARAQTRVAVVLFDNETGDAAVDRLAQALTDATVFALTAQPRLAVIGNAQVLRTKRIFRDIALVRDTLKADFIVLGQVQLQDGKILIRTHLIRAADEAHVWVHGARMTSTEAALQADVAGTMASAVADRVP